ncbi:wd-repeat protein interacting with phosphoinosides wipi -related [Anaeramoeba ignava]|uniref:Wd-repeat protein interacting with phosphoinosides wipi -related n=1 Tax=Anaeramoeba ignava TaxID=1746090 RepID=A0A9Q0LSN6_ANAIG|nr:wd-repeat protein interacting with phosphoinosides wipi -related [Anaeramoeba ignava]
MGTLIRVIESQTGKEIKQFRRGAKKAKIYSLAFDENSEFLAATSSSGTIHIFRLTPKKEKKQSEKKNKRGETGTERSVMKTKIPNKEYCVCGFDKSSNLFVVTIDGSFYKFYVDKANRQIKQVKEMYKQFLNIHDEKEKEK